MLIKSRATLFAAAIGLFFAYLSYINADWTLFERSGSLITVIAIAFFAYGVNRDVEAAAERYTTNVVEQIARRPTSSPTEEMRKWMDISSHIYTDARAIVRDAIIKEAKRTEVVILIVGTLIWGWGSYLGRVPLLNATEAIAQQEADSRTRSSICMSVLRQDSASDSAPDDIVGKLVKAGCFAQ
ncbi:hypothetical protein GAY28_20310 [Azospirillum brasilense]|nr:hypothetical protein [Azospirillum brasilense]